MNSNQTKIASVVVLGSLGAYRGWQFGKNMFKHVKGYHYVENTLAALSYATLYLSNPIFAVFNENLEIQRTISKIFTPCTLCQELQQTCDMCQKPAMSSNEVTENIGTVLVFVGVMDVIFNNNVIKIMP